MIINLSDVNTSKQFMYKRLQIFLYLVLSKWLFHDFSQFFLFEVNFSLTLMLLKRTFSIYLALLYAYERIYLKTISQTVEIYVTHC